MWVLIPRRQGMGYSKKNRVVPSTTRFFLQAKAAKICWPLLRMASRAKAVRGSQGGGVDVAVVAGGGVDGLAVLLDDVDVAMGIEGALAGESLAGLGHPEDQAFMEELVVVEVVQAHELGQVDVVAAGDAVGEFAALQGVFVRQLEVSGRQGLDQGSRGNGFGRFGLGGGSSGVGL